MADVFISYKSDDRERIQPIVDWLESNQISCWWDQRIHIDYGKEIESNLKESKVILGFVSEKSTRSNWVLAEFQTGADEGKLIPVRLDQAPIEQYPFRAVVATLSFSDFSNPQRVNAERQKLLYRLNSLLGRQSEGSGSIAPLTDSEVVAPRSIPEWICSPEVSICIPYMISLAVFEQCSHHVVQKFADLLTGMILEHQVDESIIIPKKVILRSEKLETIGAESFTYQGKYYPSPTEYIRFKNQEFRSEVINFIWNELDQFKVPFTEWLNYIVEKQPIYTAEVALALATIGQHNFNSIYQTFILKWLRKYEEGNQFRCADFTLSLLSTNPEVAVFVRKKLASLTHEYARKPENLIAVKLACGFTGLAMPDVMVEILKRTEKLVSDDSKSFKTKAELINEIIKNVSELVELDDGAEALSRSLGKFIVELSIWMAENRTSEHKNEMYFPQFIGITLFSQLEVIADMNGRVSLKAIFEEDEDDFVLDGFTKVLDSVLESDFSMLRDEAKVMLKRWCTEVNEAKKAEKDVPENVGQADYVKKVFERLLKISKTEDAQSRVKDLASRAYQFN